MYSVTWPKLPYCSQSTCIASGCAGSTAAMIAIPNQAAIIDAAGIYHIVLSDSCDLFKYDQYKCLLYIRRPGLKAEIGYVQPESTR